MKFLPGREELPIEERSIKLNGGSYVILNEGTIFENAFGCTIEIEKAYYSKGNHLPMVSYKLTKAFVTTRVRETYRDFLKDKIFYGRTGWTPMSFNYWIVKKK